MIREMVHVGFILFAACWTGYQVEQAKYGWAATFALLTIALIMS